MEGLVERHVTDRVHIPNDHCLVFGAGRQLRTTVVEAANGHVVVVIVQCLATDTRNLQHEPIFNAGTGGLVIRKKFMPGAKSLVSIV